MTDVALRPGQVAWAWLDPSVGREQSGRRPVVVVSSSRYNEIIDSLCIVVPVSGTDRGWPNHIRLRGSLDSIEGYAMTEQPRTVSRDRLADTVGQVDADCLAEIRLWLGDFLDMDRYGRT
jgi:mRNA interferase MazF